MKNCLYLFVFVALAAIGSARYLPKKEHVKQTPQEWTEIAKKLGWNDNQTSAAIDLMQFIQYSEVASAEMDTNTEWKQSMLDKCLKLANFDKVNELNDRVGDKKWKDVKDTDFTTKWEFWNDKYITWSCEHGKMMALKNICIVVTEDLKKKKYTELAKSAGYKETQWKPIADMVWEMASSNSTGLKKSILADHCEMINDDGVMFEVNEKHTNGEKWSDQADKNITMKMDFWWNVMVKAQCRVAKMKAMKNLCVEFMCPVERKEIEGFAKEAGIHDEDIKAAVDLEMRMRLVRTQDEARDIFRKDHKDLGKNKYMLEPEMTKEELEEATNIEKSEDFIKKIRFWAHKYHFSTGTNRMKCLKNMCVIVSQEEKKNELKTETA
ncbi:uncharacterized protein LOC116349225 [Contarinia nasturtii]|uniref:uncharacterized protein LOC116349225 n=1 Tax=Contarinia nasturtii TaxID=265458 RepID=UPI0012D43713|nr:uncharacterized protein LOC116349225 [Contarinia nasturtii]